MRDRHTIKDEVAKIISQKLNVEVPAIDCDLFESGILDSLQLVELLFQLEKDFRVRISLEETDLELFRTIEGIAAIIATQDGTGGWGAESLPTQPPQGC